MENLNPTVDATDTTDTSSAPPTTQKDLKESKEKEEMVSMSKVQFNQIISQIQALQTKVDLNLIDGLGPKPGVSSPVDEGKPSLPRCRVWYYTTKKGGKQLVVGYGTSMQRFNEQKEPYLEMTLLLQNGEEAKVNFKEYRDTADSEIVSVLKTDKKLKEKRYGTTVAKKLDYGNFRSTELSEEVPLISTVMEITLTVVLSDGSEVTLPHLAVN